MATTSLLRDQIACCCIIAAIYAWLASTTESVAGTAVLFLLFCIICGVIIDTRASDSLRDLFFHSIPISAALFVSMYSFGVIEAFEASRQLSNLILDGTSIAILALIAVVSLIPMILARLARTPLLHFLMNVIHAREEVRENVKVLIKFVALAVILIASPGMTEGIRQVASALYQW